MAMVAVTVEAETVAVMEGAVTEGVKVGAGRAEAMAEEETVVEKAAGAKVEVRVVAVGWRRGWRRGRRERRRRRWGRRRWWAWHRE